MSDNDFQFSNLAGMVRLRTPAPSRQLPKGVRWCEYVISTEAAKRLLKELTEQLKNDCTP